MWQQFRTKQNVAVHGKMSCQHEGWYAPGTAIRRCGAYVRARQIIEPLPMGAHLSQFTSIISSRAEAPGLPTTALQPSFRLIVNG